MASMSQTDVAALLLDADRSYGQQPNTEGHCPLTEAHAFALARAIEVVWPEPQFTSWELDKLAFCFKNRASTVILATPYRKEYAALEVKLDAMTAEDHDATQ
jgi:hypothetical protein